MKRILSALLHKSKEYSGGLEKALELAFSFSPIVEIDPNRTEYGVGINIDITASLRLFKGEKAIINSLQREFKLLGFDSRICVAPTLGCAWAVSRYALIEKEGWQIVKDKELRQVLSLLSVESLRLSEKTISALYEVNIYLISDLLSLSRDSLATRFDADLLLRLRQALGESLEFIKPKKQELIISTKETQTKFEPECLELLELLAQQLGEKSICKIRTQESYFPEKSFSYMPLSYLKQRECSFIFPEYEMPSLLFYRPHVVDIVLDNSSSLLKWQRRIFNIVQVDGPQRISPVWWGNDERLLKTRDYFKIRIESGVWLWVFKEKESLPTKWFLHGVWA